jgi:hypothetical protein
MRLNKKHLQDILDGKDLHIVIGDVEKIINIKDNTITEKSISIEDNIEELDDPITIILDSIIKAGFLYMGLNLLLVVAVVIIAICYI